MSLDAQLARMQRRIEAKNKNANVEANENPLHEITDNTVTKSHALNRAYYRFGLSEKRCMEALISKLHPMRSDNDLQEIELSAMEYAKAFNVSPKIAYRDLEKAVSKLMGVVIRMPLEEREDYTLMLKAKYKHKSGIIECCLNPYIVPHLIGLREKFSSYPLKQAVDFSSSYTWRFYEILVSWAQPKEHTGGIFAGWIKHQPVDELREMLGVPKSYKWVHFSKMLKTVEAELKEKARIHVNITRRKTVRKITHLDIEFIEDTQQQLPLEVNH